MALWELDRVALGPARLAEMTLAIRPGVTAVIGPSGAGKSSLLGLLVGFERPSAGSIRHPRTGAGAGNRLPVFWVPQDFGLWAHLTVAEHLTTVSSDPNPARILDRLDLGHLAGAKPDALSRGECSRLAVARALATDAMVLVMDEPLVNIDILGQQRYWEVILDHLAATGTSLTFASHAPESVLGTATAVILISEGRVLYHGEAETLYHSPPSARLMACLGPGNWFEPEEARRWLGQERATGFCLRPEEIAITPTPDSPVAVRAERFCGAVAEADLEHLGDQKRRRFFHRPPRATLAPGDRVGLRLLVAVLLALIATACPDQREPTLDVAAVRIWQMPPDGPRVPAPRSICAASDGEVIVLDTAGRVLIFDSEGVCDRQWKMPETAAGRPEGVAVLSTGLIAVCDTHYHRVLLFSPDGQEYLRFGQEGRQPGQFIYPVGIATDPQDNLYICEYGSNDRVQRFTADGTFVAEFGSFGSEPGRLQRPSGLLWHDGHILVADAINNRIEVFSERGTYLGTLGQPSPSLHLPYDLVLAPGPTLFVIEYGAGRVTHLGIKGEVLARYGTPGTGPGEFATPWAITLSGDRLLVADTGNRRIVELAL